MIATALRATIESSVSSGVPAEALAFYGRWWQLETWLRQLAYIELRSLHGAGWLSQLVSRAPSRAALDAINGYMASPDQSDPLAYLDVADLFDLLDDPSRWNLFEPSLLPQIRWRGVVDSLRPLRNRNAHCRRPHADDIPRVEQVLRDIEPGARRAIESYHRTLTPRRSRSAVYTGWIEGRHDVARRLLDHAERQYETSLRISWTKRPWATQPRAGVSKPPGILWYVQFISRGGRFVSAADFWADDYLYRARDLIVHVLQTDPTGLTVTFAARDKPQAVADAVGDCFDAFLTVSRRHVSDARWENWAEDSRNLDPRVQVQSALALGEGGEVPFRIFGATRRL